MTTILNTRRPGILVWLLLVATLFARAVVPAGYMPERGETGSITVTLCNSDGLWRIPLASRDDGGSEDDGHRQEAPCAFASVATPAAPADEITPPLPLLVEGSSWRARGDPMRLGAPGRHLPPARAPPFPV